MTEFGEDADNPAHLADVLNRWNKRHDAEAMLCPAGPHGLMEAVDDPETSALWWMCVTCEDIQPVTEDQVTMALGWMELPELADRPAGGEVVMPDRMPGDRGDGTVRVPVDVVEIGGDRTVHATSAQLLGVIAGALVSAAVYWQTQPVGWWLLILVVAPLAGLLIATWRFPSATVLSEEAVWATDLQRGQWVRLAAGGSAAGLATRIVRMRGLPANHRYFPGVEVHLLDGAVVECRHDDIWLVLRLA
ncbi:hypothetical protein [Kutzneria buriramensis]|uniref:Uncharacterized protein n=1 Tax=Kutzneria buriramensis TaxID=1045776 RepID=A0A3E0GXW8_9PSEU|nr:hypothetical protein [Kutzneria buriramensis]REH31113.1 hypothetical protein BCF44_122136 [Kutzneria buriramensis]